MCVSCLICSDMSHALHQFVFECMTLSSVDDAGAFQTVGFDRQLDIPWDDPYPYYAGMIPSEPPEDDPVRCTDEYNANDAASQLSDIKAGEFAFRPVVVMFFSLFYTPGAGPELYALLHLYV